MFFLLGRGRIFSAFYIFYNYYLVGVERMAAGGHVLPLSVFSSEEHVNFRNKIIVKGVPFPLRRVVGVGKGDTEVKRRFLRVEKG